MKTSRTPDIEKCIAECCLKLQTDSKWCLCSWVHDTGERSLQYFILVWM